MHEVSEGDHAVYVQLVQVGTEVLQLIVGGVELPPPQPAGDTLICAAEQVPVAEPGDVGVHVPPHAVVDQVYVQVGAGQLCTVAWSGNPPMQPEGLVPVAVLVWMDPAAHVAGCQVPYDHEVQGTLHDRTNGWSGTHPAGPVMVLVITPPEHADQPE